MYRITFLFRDGSTRTAMRTTEHDAVALFEYGIDDKTVFAAILVHGEDGELNNYVAESR